MSGLGGSEDHTPHFCHITLTDAFYKTKPSSLMLSLPSALLLPTSRASRTVTAPSHRHCLCNVMSPSHFPWPIPSSWNSLFSLSLMECFVLHRICCLWLLHFVPLLPCRMRGMLEGKRWQGEPQENHRTTGEWWWAVAGAFLEPYYQGCWVAGLWVQLNEKGDNHDMVILEVKWQEGTESRTQLGALVSSEKGALRYNNVRIMGRCRQSKNDHVSYFV